MDFFSLAAMGARQFIQHPLPNTLLVPTAEMIVYGLPGWKILGQHPPLTAAFGEVENRIHNLSPVVFWGAAKTASHLEIVGNAAPLLFAQIRQVGQFKSHAMLRVLDSLAILFSRQLLNADLKQAMGKRAPVRTKAKLREAANDHMLLLDQSPERVRSYFQDPVVKYAAG